MRTLVINIGNTSLFAGLYSDGRKETAFRIAHRDVSTLPKRLRGKPQRAVLCSVVPSLTPQALRVVRRAWNVDPVLLNADQDHGLRIDYRDPRQLGTDRLAAALGAQVLFPAQNVIVVDCGTATTVTALARDGMIRGGAILPGVALWTDALRFRTAQLPSVQIRRPRRSVGRSPTEAIASGVYFGHLGALRELIAQVRREAFGRAAVTVVGTGGHAPLFATENVFTSIQPELVLVGLNAFAMRLAETREKPRGRRASA